MFSGIKGQRRPRSACAPTQSDPGPHCPLTEPLYTTECINGEQRPGLNFVHAQEVNPHILYMSEGTFLLDVVHFTLIQ